LQSKGSMNPLFCQNLRKLRDGCEKNPEFFCRIDVAYIFGQAGPIRENECAECGMPHSVKAEF